MSQNEGCLKHEEEGLCFVLGYALWPIHTSPTNLTKVSRNWTITVKIRNWCLWSRSTSSKC